MTSTDLSGLAGELAVVTGGARGLGLSVAGALAEAGVNIALLDLLDTVTESARGLADRHGISAIGVQTDVTDQADVRRAFDQVNAELGLPTVLVTAAGITIWNDSVEVSAEEWRKVVSVNLDGTFFAAQSFARGLIGQPRPGSAIFISSMSGSIVNVPQFQASYNSSKAAVSHLAKSLAVEWAPAAIRVNSISPGYFLSDMTRQFTRQNPELAQQWVDRIPLQRMGEPEDLHGLVRYLASSASAYVTGHDFVIDGGYTIV